MSIEAKDLPVMVRGGEIMQMTQAAQQINETLLKIYGAGLGESDEPLDNFLQVGEAAMAEVNGLHQGMKSLCATLHELTERFGEQWGRKP
jgi:hypothetical protein